MDTTLPVMLFPICRSKQTKVMTKGTLDSCQNTKGRDAEPQNTTIRLVLARRFYSLVHHLQNKAAEGAEPQSSVASGVESAKQDAEPAAQGAEEVAAGPLQAVQGTGQTPPPPLPLSACCSSQQHDQQRLQFCCLRKR